jgi:uncharacterized RDD family membrane protein YckC
MTQAGPPPQTPQPPLGTPPRGAPPNAPPQGASGTAPSWQQSLTSTSSVPGPAGLFYADVPNRIIGYIIDLIVLAIIGFVVSFVFGGLLGGVTTAASLDSVGGELNLGAFILVSAVQLAVSFGYFGYFWSVQRATPGMKFLGLQIGDEADGRSIAWVQAFSRWLVLGIPSTLFAFSASIDTGLSFVFGLVGLVWLLALLYSIAQSPTKQGFHDRFAGTIMVKSGRRAT